MRHGPAADYLALKALWRDLVAACGGPCRAATITRGCQSRISEAMAPHATDRFPALDQVYDLELECGSPIVTRFMADRHDFDLVPRPGAPARPATLHHHLARLIVETADVEAGLATAIADGRLDPSERATLRREIDQAMAQLNRLRADLGPALREVGP